MLVGQSSSVCLALIIDTIVAQTTLHWLWLTCQNYPSKLCVFNILSYGPIQEVATWKGFSVHQILDELWHVAIYFKALSLSLSLKPCTCLVSQAESSKYNLSARKYVKVWPKVGFSLCLLFLC